MKATGERENSIKLERIKFRMFDCDVMCCYEEYEEFN